MLAQGLIDGKVGLGAGVGLYVGKGGAKELLCPLDGDIFHHIDALTAAIVPLSGVTLGVFIGEYAAGRGQNRGADNVL